MISLTLFYLFCTHQKICIDTRNFPIYVHCLDGKRITSLLVLMIRRLQGWAPMSALSEYWR